MPSSQNIYRRGAVYYFRRKIKLKTQMFELRLTLKTTNKCLAKRLSYCLNAFLERYKVTGIELRGRGNFLTADQKKDILTKVTAFERDRLLKLYEDESRGAANADIVDQEAVEANDQWIELHKLLPDSFKAKDSFQLVKSDLKSDNELEFFKAQLRDTSVSARYRDQISDQLGLMANTNVTDDIWRIVCQGIVNAAQQINSQITGETTVVAENNVVPITPSVPVQQNVQILSEGTLMERFDIFSAQQQTSGLWGNTAAADAKTSITRYSEIYPNDRVIDITQAKMKNYLMCMERKVVRQGFTEGQKPEDLKGNGLTPDKINTAVRAIKQVIDFDRSEGFEVQSIEWDLLKTKKKDIRAKNEKTEYILLEDAERLFQLPMFTGAAGMDIKEKARFTAGRHIYHDSCYWVPLMLYYTGARPAEICGLTVHDFFEVEGRLCCVIRANYLGGIKRIASYRIIPLHKELLRLGLKEFILESHKAGREALFPEITPIRKGTLISEVFNRLVWSKFKKAGLFDDFKDATIVPSGFRKTTQSIVSRDNAVQDRLIEEFLGREHGQTGNIVYNAGGFMPSLDLVNDAMEIITSHLEPAPINLIPSARVVGRRVIGKKFDAMPDDSFWGKGHLDLMKETDDRLKKYMHRYDLNLLCS